jgi:hypothetical protein
MNKRNTTTSVTNAEVMAEIRKFGSVITGIKKMMDEHGKMMKVIYGDDDNPVEKPGLIRDVTSLQRAHTYVTHAVTGALCSLGTALLGGLGYWIFHR